MLKIIKYANKYKNAVPKFILEVLEGEFGFTGIERPDIYNIPEHYHIGTSKFWLAIERGIVIGTIAIIDCGRHRGFLRRMYVAKEFRGKGIGTKLLETLLRYTKKHDYKRIFLWTDSEMVEAIKMYEKKGFKRIKAPPKDFHFLRLSDSIFYKLEL
ncbi:MAG: GNAT family N-acetyltransferase [Candidatus Micrarchaeota archaeon]|nr:GNAT family N-acetyltransferase [Candidatus Micrarchaeota archaeon]